MCSAHENHNSSINASRSKLCSLCATQTKYNWFAFYHHFLSFLFSFIAKCVFRLSKNSEENKESNNRMSIGTVNFYLTSFLEMIKYQLFDRVFSSFFFIFLSRVETFVFLFFSISLECVCLSKEYSTLFSQCVSFFSPVSVVVVNFISFLRNCTRNKFIMIRQESFCKRKDEKYFSKQTKNACKKYQMT